MHLFDVCWTVRRVSFRMLLLLRVLSFMVCCALAICTCLFQFHNRFFVRSLVRNDTRWVRQPVHLLTFIQNTNKTWRCHHTGAIEYLDANCNCGGDVDACHIREGPFGGSEKKSQNCIWFLQFWGNFSNFPPWDHSSISNSDPPQIYLMVNIPNLRFFLFGLI